LQLVVAIFDERIGLKMNATEKAEHYTYLKGERTKNKRWFSFSMFAFNASLILAFILGNEDGWGWLLVSIFTMFMGLWSLIEFRHFDALIAIHLLPDERRNSAN